MLSCTACSPQPSLAAPHESQRSQELDQECPDAATDDSGFSSSDLEELGSCRWSMHGARACAEKLDLDPCEQCADVAALAPAPLCRQALRQELDSFADEKLRVLIRTELSMLLTPQPSMQSNRRVPSQTLSQYRTSLTNLQQVPLPEEQVPSEGELEDDDSVDWQASCEVHRVLNKIGAYGIVSEKSPLETTLDKLLCWYKSTTHWSDSECSLPLLERFESSCFFRSISALLILANAYTMALSANYQASNFEDPNGSVFARLEWIFVFAYTGELIIRMLSKRGRFVRDGWCWFDLVIVMGGFMEMIRRSHKSVTRWRMVHALKLLKVMRLLRLVRLGRGLREVRLLFDSLLGSFRPLVLTIGLILSTNFVFAVLFVDMIAEYLAEQWRLGHPAIENTQQESLLASWGSVPAAMFTLFSCANGGEDWRDVASLLREAGWQAFAIFILYLMTFLFAITNSVCAIFVEAAAEYAKGDRSRVIQEQLAMKKEYVAMVVQVYRETVADQAGYLSKAEFIARMDDPRMAEFASALEIGTVDLEHFFDVMSSHGRRSVDLASFVEGCIRLRGQARSMDVVEILMQQGRLRRDIRRLGSLLRACGPCSAGAPQRGDGLDVELPMRLSPMPHSASGGCSSATLGVMSGQPSLGGRPSLSGMTC